MRELIGFVLVAAAAVTALFAWRKDKREKDVVVDSLRCRGAY